MKFKVAIRKKPILKDGTTNIKIRITHEHKTRYIATDYYILPRYFDKVNGLIKPGGEFTQEKADRANAKLLIQKAQLAEKALSVKQKNDIKGMMSTLRDKRTVIDLYAILDDRIKKFERLGNENYVDVVKSTKASVKEFSGEGLLPFEAITYSWLSRFEQWLMEKKRSVNTIGIKMREIRTVYNEAINQGHAELSSYPFRKYKIPKRTTSKRNLSAQDLYKIATVEIKQPLMRWARDMAILSFYLIGINMKDMFYLRGIEEGRVNYIRSKGKRSYSILVQPEAEHIINRYPGKRYLLNVLDNYSKYRSATKRVNYKLKTIASLCKIDKPVTTYYMRHSWASIGASIGISKDVLSYGLGHILGSEMTTIYVDFNLKLVDEANRKIIDYLMTCSNQ